MPLWRWVRSRSVQPCKYHVYTDLLLFCCFVFFPEHIYKELSCLCLNHSLLLSPSSSSQVKFRTEKLFSGEIQNLILWIWHFSIHPMHCPFHLPNPIICITPYITTGRWKKSVIFLSQEMFSKATFLREGLLRPLWHAFTSLKFKKRNDRKPELAKGNFCKKSYCMLRGENSTYIQT